VWGWWKGDDFKSTIPSEYLDGTKQWSEAPKKPEDWDQAKKTALDN
jgi:hypothetical protein